MYLGNNAFSPPTAPDLFQIDNLNIIDAAISAGKVQAAAIEFAKLADGAVSGTKIADGGITTSAKIVDGIIVTAKIADAAIVSAKIGDLQVVTAKIADLAVNDAKIANLAVTSAKIANLAVGTAQINNAAITNAKIGALAVDTANIANAAITTAKIGAAQITTALIANAAITNALIANLAVGTANIQDASVTSAKIIDLVVSKITAGTLNAVIDIGTGALKFTIGGSQLILGRGFGSSNQFFLWYGPQQAALTDCTEANGVVWFKTNGSAYFGGSLSAGTLRTSIGTSDTSSTASIICGPFGSNGNPRVVVLSYNFQRTFNVTNAVTNSGTTSATLYLDRYDFGTSSWVLAIATLSVTGTVDNNSAPGDTGNLVVENMGGSVTFTDNTGGIQAQYRGRISARSNQTIGGGGTVNSISTTQQVNVTSTEG